MKKIFNKLLLLSFAAVLIACSSEDELTEDWIEVNEVESPDPGDAGTLDLSNYISIGNSLTAGFADGALYTQGQENSFPNLLATQFAMVETGVSFNQPDINSENGYHTSLNPSGVTGLVFGRTVLDLSLQAPVPTTTGEEIAAFAGTKAELNNFGVPGMRITQVETAGYGFPGAGNPFFTRFAVNPNTSSVLGDALAVDRSFFTFWLGANDYLGYASSGGQGNTPLADLDGTGFANALGSALGQLTADGTPGVVVDLPPVVTLPFFQAVSWNAIELDEATAETLNSNLAAVNGAIQATPMVGYTGEVDPRLISYSAGDNPILVHDEELEDLGPYFDILLGADQITPAQRAALAPYEQSRPLVDGELVLLTAGAVLGNEADGDDTVADTPIGVAIPLGYNLADPGSSNGDQYFLNVEEQTAIVTARATYNGAIQQTVAALNGGGADIALVSIQPLFVDVLGLDVATATALALPTATADGVQGIDIDGAVLAPDFAPNGIFSSDGIHPNPRGHAIVANAIIEAMNERWNASIPTISVLTKLGVTFQP